MKIFNLLVFVISFLFSFSLTSSYIAADRRVDPLRSSVQAYPAGDSSHLGSLTLRVKNGSLEVVPGRRGFTS